MNRKSIGICVVGDFDSLRPSDELLNRLRKFTLGLMTVLDIPPEQVIGHRDAGLMDGFDWRKGEYKSCPGKKFPLDEFKLSLI
jgi:N-acetyl-anhydromuramyl-L-alanine amidase AmpD